MPDVIAERAEREEANRVAKEAIRDALIAAALAVPAPVEPVAEVASDSQVGWVFGDE
jgi:hypothetical protein